MALFGPRVGHEALFDEVCTYHNFDKKQKTLLQSVVKKYQMERAAEIFIEPDTLRRALSDADFAAENADLQKLYDAWFIDARRK
jgi:DNA polymerase III epsilon subunit-like protein